MPIVTRIANWFELILGSLDADDTFDESEEDGFLMAASETNPGPAMPQAAAGLPQEAMPQNLRIVRPQAGEDEADAVVEPPQSPLVAEADPGDQVEQSDGSSSAPTLAPEDPDDPAEDAPAEPAEPQSAPAASGDDDVMSMFREVSGGTELQDLTKEIEHVTAQELLAEAREVRGLLGIPEGTSEQPE
jgi:hypothetical protein